MPDTEPKERKGLDYSGRPLAASFVRMRKRPGDWIDDGIRFAWLRPIRSDRFYRAILHFGPIGVLIEGLEGGKIFKRREAFLREFAAHIEAPHV